jgi:translation initiation factor IF-3
VITRADARKFSQVRLIEDELKEIVNITEAINRAEEAGLDLVLVSDKSTPPVVRIQDSNKLKYEAEKSRKKQRVQDVKEIQLKLNIADHDLQTKIGAIEKFLGRGDKVKVAVRLFGREKENPERARILLERVTNVVKCKVSYIPGPFALAILEPLK